MARIRANDTAVVIFSFNRPAYLQEVLGSLERNREIDGFDFYFYQDGAVNRFSGRLAAYQEDIDACIALWQAARLPNKRLVKRAFNVGIGTNQFTARVDVFESLMYPQAVFLEDDLVLGRNYLRLIRAMLRQFKGCERIGGVMAHGRPALTATREQKLHNLRRVEPSYGNLWAWGTWHDRWQRIKPTFELYYRLIESVDYKDRPNDDIVAFYKSHDNNNTITSQDAAVHFAFSRSGLLVLNTVINRSRYIGAVGEHMVPELFEEYGFKNVVLDEFAEDDVMDTFELVGLPVEAK